MAKRLGYGVGVPVGMVQTSASQRAMDEATNLARQIECGAIPSWPPPLTLEQAQAIVARVKYKPNWRFELHEAVWSAIAPGGGTWIAPGVTR